MADRLVTGVFLRITFATFLYFALVGMLVPTVPLYVKGTLGGSNALVGLTVAAFSISAVLLRPWSGHLGDRRGRRILMICGPAVVGVSVALYPLTHSLGLLIALRLLGGIGEAFFYTGAASAINDLAPDARRGEATSLFSLALYSGLAVGPVVAETLLKARGFTLPWLIAGVLGGGAALMALTVPETKPAAVGVRAPTPLLHPAALLPGMVLAASVWGLAGFNAFIPLHARSIGMESSRLVFAGYSIVVLSIRGFGARLPDKLGVVRAARISLLASVAGLVVIGAIGGRPALVIGAAVFGLGQALAFPALMTMAVRHAPAEQRGSVVGTFTAFFDLAFGGGAAALGVVAGRFGYPPTFLVAAGVTLCGLAALVRAR